MIEDIQLYISIVYKIFNCSHDDNDNTSSHQCK